MTGRQLRGAAAALFSRIGLPLAALFVAGLVWWPLHVSGSRALEDALLRLCGKPANFDKVLIVDIDDASLRSLRAQLGSWPYDRSVYALLLDYLREAGAKTVVFDIVFSDRRAGDDAFARAIAGRDDTVLAASALDHAVEDGGAERRALQRLAAPDSADLAALHWPAMDTPAPALLAALPGEGRLGVVTAPLDDDHRLRRVPLLHAVYGRVLPSLPLAAHMRNQRDAHPSGAPPQAPPAPLVFALPPWAAANADPAIVLLPGNATRVPQISLQRVAGNALGQAADPEVARAIAGRTVFVGSSAFFADTVTTAQGVLSGTGLMASAFVALEQGDLARPAPWPWQGAMLLLALLPAACGLRLTRPLSRLDIGVTALALAAILAVPFVALRDYAMLVSPLPALLVLSALLACYGFAHWRLLVRANARLAEQRRVAELASAAKSRFLANVSHELRTPLNAVVGMADVLARTPLDFKQRGYVDVFRSAGAALGVLIDDLLDVARIEAGKLRLQRRGFSLHTALRDCVALLQVQAHAKGIALNLDIGAGVRDQVFGDDRRLVQVLTNLLGNAIKFTQQGQVDLRVTRRPGERLAFAVSDTGIGIAPAELASIFDPFSQGGADIPQRYGGTGLGLSIAKPLVEAMGGRLEVHSAIGQGSVFSFEVELPQAEGVRPAAQAPQASRTAPAPLRVLLADDNEVNVIVLQSMLPEPDYALQVAPDGRRAVEMFRDQAFDLVLMDIHMPVMDGLQATQSMRRIEAERAAPRTPIVALSASATPEGVRDSQRAGCDMHLTKPVAHERLLEVIAACARGDVRGAANGAGLSRV